MIQAGVVLTVGRVGILGQHRPAVSHSPHHQRNTALVFPWTEGFLACRHFRAKIGKVLGKVNQVVHPVFQSRKSTVPKLLVET